MKYKKHVHELFFLLFILIFVITGNASARTHTVVVHKKTYTKTVVKLPKGHAKIVVSGNPYFFHNGVFYKKAPKGYVVVKTPVGARVKTLPRGYSVVRVGGRKYYLHQGIYFDFDPVRKVYVVVDRPNTDFVINYQPLHRVQLADGSIYDGVYLGGTKDAVEMEVDEEIWEIPVEEIEYISFVLGQ